MPELNELLALAKSVASQAGQKLLDNYKSSYKEYVQCPELPREIKAGADAVLEKDILQLLAPAGLPILSEESGYLQGQQDSGYIFIVDPLDGTFNFVKDLGPCAVSIALWNDKKPIFGVIYNLEDKKLFWGGHGMGAYCDDQPISVSNTSSLAEASICTGFPVRFDVGNDIVMQNFWDLIKPFAKVRMIGSAAVSLLNVAKGSSDVYSEHSIMLWDVAAGLAIVEGAGGEIQCLPATIEYSLDVYASNKYLIKH